jgi:hypothetical protein
VNGTGAQLVVVEQQVLQVLDGGQRVLGDLTDGVLLQVEQHQAARKPRGHHAQVVVGQVQTLQTAQLAGKHTDPTITKRLLVSFDGWDLFVASW